MNLYRARAAREWLVAKGWIRDSGCRRNGQIVWVITELGKQVMQLHLADADQSLGEEEED